MRKTTQADRPRMANGQSSGPRMVLIHTIAQATKRNRRLDGSCAKPFGDTADMTRSKLGPSFERSLGKGATQVDAT